MALELKPDVILLDISMPDINGIDAARSIRQADQLVKIILLTLHNTKQSVRSAFLAGANGYLLKADAEGELILALNTVVSQANYLSPSLDPAILKDLKNEPTDSHPV